jgi:stearoyl-CoA desaturase (delta-9 desaturase)
VIERPIVQPPAPRSLPLPAAVRTGKRIRLRWAYAISIAVVHALALLAAFPYFFTWSGLIFCLFGLYIFGTLGVNLGFHRLLTHRSFKCPRWVERTVALLGVCCLQEGPARWVAIHRKHHQQSDEQPDPHSPLVTFLWGHVGWLIVENLDTDSFHLLQRYSRDLASQPFYLGLEKKLRWLWVYVAHALIIAAAAFAIGWFLTSTIPGAIKFTASIVVWGVILRTVLVWHITWSVNSLSHLFGYQSFQTGENSRNNWFVALISNGEGWHNNHHGDQRSAAHGHKWYELDVTYLTIRVMQLLGLATNVMTHDRHSEPLA